MANLGTLCVARHYHASLAIAAALMLGILQGCSNTAPSTPEAPAVSTSNAPPRPAAVPFTKKHIYSETADPGRDIAAALKEAKREQKHVLIDFGGDWCGDCQVLHFYFDQAPNKDLLEKNYVVVNVFVNSQIDNHLEVGTKYGIPLKKGVPAIAVLDANGKVLYSPQNRESEAMSRSDAHSVTAFLNQWKS